jgi:hypothetical protein
VKEEERRKKDCDKDSGRLEGKRKMPHTKGSQ